jgi:small subunit ribosomal protein S21
MLIVEVNREKNIESALRVYKNKVQKTKLVQELKKRKEFVKVSVKKRNEKLKAIHIQRLRNGLED